MLRRMALRLPLIALLIAALAAPTAMAHADTANSDPVLGGEPIPEADNPVHRDIRVDFADSTVAIATTFMGGVAGTTVSIVASSCRATIGQVEAPFPMDGSSVVMTVPRKSVGPRIDFTFTFVIPDQPTRSYSVFVSNDEGDKCAASGTGTVPTVPRAWVKRWSKRSGGHTASVGKSLKVTPTTLTGAGRKGHAKVTYHWFVGGKRVGSGRTLKVKKSYVKKQIVAKATVSKQGYASQWRKVSFKARS